LVIDVGMLAEDNENLVRYLGWTHPETSVLLIGDETDARPASFRGSRFVSKLIVREALLSALGAAVHDGAKGQSHKS